MRSRLLLAVLAAASAFAQEGAQLDPRNSVRFDLGPNAPLSVVESSVGESRQNVRGGAVMLDLHLQLSLRNDDAKRVRGVTLIVLAQESAPFGKASVTKCVDIGPGEVFPLRVDVRLVRPVQTSGPLVRVALDGVLFNDFTFVGPNQLNSKRAMTFYETEARRDRAWFRETLRARGVAGLRQEVIESLARQKERPALDVSVARNGVATAQGEPRVAQFAFLELPDAPVKPVSGSAEVAGNEVRSPRVDVLNQTQRSVKYVEISWLVTDPQGREYLASSLPGAETDRWIAPGRAGHLRQNTTLKFAHAGTGEPVGVRKMTGFVSEVEFLDGKVWVPRREALIRDSLIRLIAPSPEEQRLTDLYRKRGIQALLQELARIQD